MPPSSMLQNERVWVDDPAKRMRNLEVLRRNPDRCQALFVGWCHETARDADPAAIEPDRVLADGLRESLRLAAREHPLLLLLDTCEVLSADLDRWLRTLLAPLCRDETPLLVLIGSRLDPDVALPAGSREGWQIELPRERFRPVPFNDQVSFSVEEIEAALGQFRRPVEWERASLAESLHRVTRGVPLAVRALLDHLGEHGSEEFSSTSWPKGTMTSFPTNARLFVASSGRSPAGCFTTSTWNAGRNARTTCATSSPWPYCNGPTGKSSGNSGPAGVSAIAYAT